MDRDSSLIFPGSKTLGQWWRQLQSHQPHALWIGYAFLHRIEAPVRVVRTQAMDSLTHMVLRAFSLEQSPLADGSVLERRLGLPIALTQRVLRELQRAGLVEPSGAGLAISPRGRHALEHRHYPEPARERRGFTFLERLDVAGQRVGPAAFVPIAECPAVTWQVDDAHRFEIGWLENCIEQSADWKQAAGFPLDVEALDGGGAIEEWQRIVIDRPERIMLAMVLTPGLERLAFAVKVDGWALQEKTPVLRLSAAIGCPELAPEPTAAQCQEAWRDWCRQKQLPAAEVESCVLTPRPPRLEVQMPPRLLQRLQAGKSDLFKGDAWLLIGDGYFRAATQLSPRS